MTLLAIGLLSVAHFMRLGEGGLFAWDECSYALRARLALRGHWLDQMPYCYAFPGLNGFYSGAFPPLLIWAMALSFSALGPTTLAARLPSALLGTAAVWILWLWGRALWDRATGFWAAFIMASLTFTMMYHQRAQFDGPVSCFILLTVALGARYYQTDRRRWLVLAGAAMGLGLMTKILVAGFAAVILLLTAGLLWARGALRLRRIVLDQVILNAIGVGLALPWHLYMIEKYRAPTGEWFAGNAFLDYWWGYHVSRRASEGIGHMNFQWHFYFREFFERMGALWTGLMAIALAWGGWRVGAWVARGWWRRERPDAAGKSPSEAAPRGPVSWGEEQSLLFPVMWVLFAGAILVSSSHKYKTYLTLLAPPLALLAARLLVLAWRGHFGRARTLSLAGMILLCYIASRAASLSRRLEAWAVSDAGLPEIAWRLIEQGWPLVAGTLVGVAALDVMSRRWTIARRAPMTAAFACVTLYAFSSGFSNHLDDKPLEAPTWALVHEAMLKPDFTRVVFLGELGQPDSWYYLDGLAQGWRADLGFRQITRADDARSAPEPLDPATLVIVSRHWLAETRQKSADLTELLPGYQPIREDRYFLLLRAPSAQLSS